MFLWRWFALRHHLLRLRQRQSPHVGRRCAPRDGDQRLRPAERPDQSGDGPRHPCVHLRQCWRSLTMTAPDLPTTSYSYDNDGNLKTITQGASSVGFTYNQDNETTAVALPDGDTRNYTPDADGEVTAEAVKHGSKSLGYARLHLRSGRKRDWHLGKVPDADPAGRRIDFDLQRRRRGNDLQRRQPHLRQRRRSDQ